MKRYLLKMLPPLMLAATLIPAGAMATCSLEGGTGIVNFSFDTVTVPQNAAVGSILASKTVTFTTNDGSGNFYCDSSGGHDYLFTNNASTIYGSPVSGLAHTYATNIKGVGFKVYYSTHFAYFDNPPHTYNNAPNTGWTFNGTDLTMQLIKTGNNIENGNLTPGEVANDMLDTGQKSMSLRLTQGTIVAQ